MTQIYIGNLTYSTSGTDLRFMFEKYGKVSSIRLATDKSTGRSRGFAFVTMNRLDDADEAIVRLNGSQMNGRSIVVTQARGDREIAESTVRKDAINRLDLL